MLKMVEMAAMVEIVAMVMEAMVVMVAIAILVEEETEGMAVIVNTEKVEMEGMEETDQKVVVEEVMEVEGHLEMEIMVKMAIRNN
jgi:hypothetical protein